MFNNDIKMVINKWWYKVNNDVDFIWIFFFFGNFIDNKVKYVY